MNLNKKFIIDQINTPELKNKILCVRICSRQVILKISQLKFCICHS